MIRLQEIPLLLLMGFTLVYAIIGDPDDKIWSGVYFFVHYLTLLCLFWGHKSKVIRLTGISLSIAVLVFIAIQHFINEDVERYYTLIPFFICLLGIFKLEQKQ